MNSECYYLQFSISFCISVSIFLAVSGAQYKNNCAFYNYMVKARLKKEAIISPHVPLPCDIMRNFIITYSDLETIGRLGQTCKEYYQCYRDKVVCKIPQKQPIENVCNSLMCQISCQDFDANTAILAMYAKKYKKSDCKDIQALWMFNHLWQHHATERLKGVSDVLEVKDPTMEQCMQLYAGNYDRLLKRCIKNQTPYSLQEEQLASLGKTNVKKIEGFVTSQNIVAVKTMLLTNRVLYTKNRLSFLEKMYSLENIFIMKKLYSRCAIDWHDIIMCALFCKKYDLIFYLIKRHKKWAIYERFNIWKNIVIYRVASLYPVVDLLFADDINEISSLDGAGLLHKAICSRNLEAVTFLLSKNIDVNQICNGTTPLHQASNSSAITSLLLQHDANVNQKDGDGRTALMGIMLHSFLQGEMEKVLDILLEYGADASILDQNNNSVLHYIGLSCLDHDIKKISCIVSKLIEHGAVIETKNKYGKTPLDYATFMNKVNLVKILTAELQKDKHQISRDRDDEKYKEQLPMQCSTDRPIKLETIIPNERPISCYKKVFLYSLGLTTSAVIGYFLLQWLSN